MKVNIEIDCETESHKLEAHLRGPEYKQVLDGVALEIESLLSSGHPFTSADRVLLHLQEKIKKDANYFNICIN
jgi:hypothetical protein